MIVDLLLKLQEAKILAAVPVSMNHIKGCPRDAEKDLKKHGRGSSCYIFN